MTSLLLRNLLFTILKPGVVAGLIPYLILRNEWKSIIQSIVFRHFVGGGVFLLGFTVMLHCILRFAFEGGGTLSPADPTKKLVISGLYRYSRNPMYIGVITMLIGEAVFSNAISLWVYLLLVFTVFNLFIFLIEEPRLRKDFGEEYRSYCQKVRRWI